MKAIKNTISRFKVLKDLFKFFWERKLWWLIPLVMVLLLFGLLIIFAQSSSIAPFIYVLF